MKFVACSVPGVLRALWKVLLICMVTAASPKTGFAQTITITNTAFQAGPFGQGSTIGVPISMTGCFRWNNTIRLYLCTPANTNGTLIGTMPNGSFSTFVNGRIPNGTPAATNYYVEARTDFPVTRSNASTNFEVRNVAAPGSFVNVTSANRRLVDSLFYGYCSGSPSTPRNITLVNQSSPGSTTTLQYKNEFTGVITNLTLPINATADITLDVTYYTLFTRADLGGVISTRYIFLVNPTHNTGLGQSGELRACLPDPLRVAMDTTNSPLGIKRNFPGAYFVFDWGDAARNDTLTHCELNAMGGIIPHVYTDNSCGKDAVLGSQTIRNAYPIDIRYVNPFARPGNPNNCDGAVNAGFARIFRRPVANFQPPDRGCVNVAQTFTNSTVAGVALAGDVCSPNQEYEWYINGNLVGIGRNLVYTFPAVGTYQVRLKVENASCAPSEVTKPFCVEAVPSVNFRMNGLDSIGGCADLPFTINNLTTGLLCGPSYKWRVFNDSTNTLVNPNAGVYTITPNDSAFQPQFVFHIPGRWRVELTVASGCGTYRVSKIVKVLGTTTFNLRPDIGYCNTGMTIDFRNHPNHRPTYGQSLGTEAYLWTITGGAFSFQGGTSATDPFPQIRFNDVAVYNVTVRYTTQCGVSTKTQRISFSQPIDIDAGPDTLNICYDQPSISFTGTVVGAIDSAVWSTNGTGSFNPRNQPATVYTISTADKNRGALLLIYKAFTPPGSACTTVSDSVHVRIYPNNTANDTTKAVCSGQNVSFNPASSTAGSTFSWASTIITGTVTGNTATGNGNINDVLTNTTTSDARVEYIITPRTPTCAGEPYSLMVTVKPRPTLTVRAEPDSICTGEMATIQLTSSLPATQYTWTSTITSGTVTGNTNGINQAITSISNTLLNASTNTGVVSYAITPTTAGCTGSAVSTPITVLAGVSPATAGADQYLCAVTQATLNGNTPVRGTGNWRQLSGNVVTIVNAALPATPINGLMADSTYRFIWEINGAGAYCGNSRDTVTIYVRQQTTVANAGRDSVSCAVNIASYMLQGNAPRSYETGAWVILNSTMNPQPALQNPSNANANISNLSMGSITLRWTISSDATGCSATRDDVTITIGATLFVANAGSNQILCNQPTANLTANSAVGTNGAWTLLGSSTAIIDNPSQNLSSVSNLTPGQYGFIWTLNNGVCPPSRDTVSISILPGLQNTLTDPTQVICRQQHVTIGGGLPTGGTGNYLYQWQQSTDNINFTNIPGAIAAGIDVSPLVNTWYRRIVSSLPCNNASNAVLVEVRSDITNNTIGADQLICIDTRADILTGSSSSGGYGNIIYQWETSTNGNVWTPVVPGDGINYDPGIVSQNTWYRRKVVTANCLDVDPAISNIIRINVNPDAKAEFNPHPTRGCPPLFINNTVLNPNFYSDRNASWIWLRDDVVKSTTPIYPADTMLRIYDSTTITLIAISKFGCKNDTVRHGFATGAPPTVDLGTGDSVRAGTKVRFDPIITNGPIVNYSWTPLFSGLDCYNCRNPEATVSNDVIYRLEVINSFGCKASDTVHYKVYCDPSQIYLPNIFSPDGDGHNDVYMVRGEGLMNVTLKIYNRWGQLVFEKANLRPNNVSDGWDGKVNGRIIQDTYVFVVEADCTKGGHYKREGNLTLIVVR